MANLRTLRNVGASAAVGLVLVAGFGATAFARNDGDHKVSICHYIGKDPGSFVVQITVDEHAVPGHLAHGDVLADEYGQCPA